MALIKRNGVYWIDAQINGTRVRESLKTTDPKQAQHLHDLRRAELWQGKVLKVKPKHTFRQACARWLVEKEHKKSLKDDKLKIDWFLPIFGDKPLAEITRDLVEEALPPNVKPATRNRYRALMRSMLRAAERDWEWLDRAPIIKGEVEQNKRVAFLSREQAELLVQSLPEKYRMPVRFALLTGLRRSNIFGLTWDRVNLERGTAIVYGEDAKAGKDILVPLNKQARELLASLPEPHTGRVWGDVTRVWCNTWKAATKRAGVPGFRFHDLRHTWASWHAMAGTPLPVLQELGGWASHEMVQRYAHLSPEHLAAAAEKVSL